MTKFWLFGGFKNELFEGNFPGYDGRWGTRKYARESQKRGLFSDWIAVVGRLFAVHCADF